MQYNYRFYSDTLMSNLMTGPKHGFFCIASYSAARRDVPNRNKLFTTSSERIDSCCIDCPFNVRNLKHKDIVRHYYYKFAA